MSRRMYKGYPIQMYWQDLEYLNEFMGEFKPATVIELGTGTGASAMFFKDFRSVMSVFTFDINSARRILTLPSVTYNEMDIFAADVLREIELIIKEGGKTFIMCDNGNKPLEFKTFAPMLKKDDMIAVHDWGIEIKRSDCLGVVRDWGLKPYEHGRAAQINTLVRGWIK